MITLLQLEVPPVGDSPTCVTVTLPLQLSDVVTEPMLPVDGMLAVSRPEVDESALARLTAPDDRVVHWRRRLEAVGQDRAS